MIAQRPATPAPTPIAEPATRAGADPAPVQAEQRAVVADASPQTSAEPERPASAASDEPLATRPEDAKTPFDPELDEKRLNAVRNIFDAEDVDEDIEFV